MAVTLTQLEQILYQLHHLKPEACDKADFYKVILREKKIPADNLQSALCNYILRHYRGKKIKITIFTLHDTYAICKV